MLRNDGRNLVCRCRQPDALLSAGDALAQVESLLRNYSAEFRLDALSALLSELLELARDKQHFSLSIDDCLESFALAYPGAGPVILTTFFNETVTAFRLSWEEGITIRPWDCLPEVPQGYEEFGGLLFGALLDLYCQCQRERGWKYDLMTECWSRIPSHHLAYVSAFCKCFRLPLPDGSVRQYQLKTVVGVGGMGVVYYAIHHHLGARVAVKLMRPDCPHKHRFFQEGRRTVQLRDRQFVIVRDGELGSEADSPFFVMDYVEGGKSLSDLIDGSTPLPAEQLAKILYRVARAVHSLHEKGFLHCDLKPGNILISKAEPLVSDLGLSRPLNHKSGTSRGEPFSGTPSYASPEQAAGDPLTPRSDVYQLGAILYRGLTGQSPFRKRTPDETDEATLARVSSEPLVHPKAIRHHIGPDLEAICVKALDKDPLYRYPSAAHFADDLGRYLRREPVLARAGYQRRVLIHKAIRSVWTWAIAVAAILALAGSYLHVLLRENQARKDREAYLNRQEVDGCLASTNRYRTTAPVSVRKLDLRPSRDPLLYPRLGASTVGLLGSPLGQGHVSVLARWSVEGFAPWPNPDYSGFTILRTSLFVDLSNWTAIPEGATPANAGRIEPALMTRVVDLIRKESVSGNNSRVFFQFRTEGFDYDLHCPDHEYIVRGSIEHEQLGGSTKPVWVREIAIDISDVSPGKEVRLIIQGTSWNGYQYNSERKQWTAFLAPDNLSEGELAVRFAHGHKPSTPPTLFVFQKGSPRREVAALTQNFTNPLDRDWWVWRPRDIVRDNVYQIEWAWAPDSPH